MEIDHFISVKAMNRHTPQSDSNLLQKKEECALQSTHIQSPHKNRIFQERRLNLKYKPDLF